jgi:hypothetical protein
MIHLPHEDLAKFWIQAKYEYTIFKQTSFYIFGYLLETCIEIWKFFCKFWLNFWLLEISKKNFDFSTFSNFNIAFWLCIANEKKKIKKKEGGAVVRISYGVGGYLLVFVQVSIFNPVCIQTRVIE